MNTSVSRACEEGLELSLTERSRILFETLGMEFTASEGERMYGRAERILSDSGVHSRPPRINPEAAPALRSLKKEFPQLKIGLISNAGRSSGTYARVLESLGVMRFFDSLTISCDVGFVKPRREIFEHATKSLSVRPSETLHVGDYFRSDVVGATSYGMSAALYTGLWHRYSSNQGPSLERIPEGFSAGRGYATEISSLHEVAAMVRKSR